MDLTDEALGRLAELAWTTHREGYGQFAPDPGLIVPQWHNLLPHQQERWRGVARALRDAVRAEQQAARAAEVERLRGALLYVQHNVGMSVRSERIVASALAPGRMDSLAAAPPTGGE